MNETPPPQDNRFLAEAKRILDQSVQSLDHHKIVGLQRARMLALEQGPHRRPLIGWTWVSGLAVASVAVLCMVFLLNRQDTSNQHHPMLEDLELMTSTENVELSEDLDFYDWLAETTGVTG